MQMISFLPPVAAGAKCEAAVAPVVFQSADVIASGTGSSPIVVADVVAGDPAYFGGQIVVRGCSDVLVQLNYLDGDDCQICTAPDALALVARSLIIPANSSFPLPDGYWQDMSITAVDSTGAPQNVQTDVSVMTYSSHKPACPDCVVLAI